MIPVSVLAVLQFTSEYTTGLIRTTFSAVPQRWAVLAGKAYPDRRRQRLLFLYKFFLNNFI